MSRRREYHIVYLFIFKKNMLTHKNTESNVDTKKGRQTSSSLDTWRVSTPDQKSDATSVVPNTQRKLGYLSEVLSELTRSTKVSDTCIVNTAF